MILTLAIALLIMCASFIATITGFGFSTIAIPVLSLFFPLKTVIVPVSILHWFGSVWKVILFHRGFNWRIIISFGIPSVIAAYAGAQVAFGDGMENMSRCLGVFMIAYVIFLWRYSDFHIEPTFASNTVGGALSGFSMGFFGIGGALKNAFLLAYDLPKALHLATVGAIAFCVDSTRLLAYMQAGLSLSDDFKWGLLVFVPASFIGAKSAQRYIDSVSQDKFRLGVGIFLLVVGIKLVLMP